MKKKIFNILKYTLFTALGIVLFWLVYRDQNFADIWYTVKNEIDYRWIVLSLFFGLLSHISRSIRWKLALEPLGENPRFSNTFIIVMLSYFMNLLLPRMGEIARCGMMSKYEKISFSKLLGTIITERIIDVIMLGSLFTVVLVVEMDKMVFFAKQNPAVISKINTILHSPIPYIAITLLAAVTIVYFKRNKKRNIQNRITQIINDIAKGVKSVTKIKRYKAYIGHTLFIWLMYTLMLYSVFFALPVTSHLNPMAGLTTFIMASFGMLAPVQGGIGAWHFMAEKALELYGIASVDGKTVALVAHTSMNVMVLIIGFACLIYLPINNRKSLSKQNQ